ncbi:MAG: MerR family transcriptional regulator [Chloroflexi bacterium]|nr:MerR family transcriptional regulator [Chloroflexota bacterium]MDL1944622.1 MerR family transcriptional regulator [Chloroflexi bacterium CFX2]
MFKIGEFSKLSRVSVRMLRHYDQFGLLTPSQTDPFTGYRYYSASQLPRLNRILALRDLGFSLEQIAEVLDDDVSADQLLGMLKLKRADVEQQMREEQNRLARLEARIRQMSESEAHRRYDVILRDVESELVAALREAAVDDDAITAMFDKVEMYVARFEGARADKPPFAIYYDDEYRDKDMDAEVAVPLKYAIPESESIRVRQTPKLFNVACVVHVGNYSEVYQAYNALSNWIETNGYQMTGPIREVYLRYGADGLGFELPSTHLEPDSNQYVTELQLTVEKL